jgi:dipeptidyl aminopeptidase/acylaminoacyl peptidase
MMRVSRLDVSTVKLGFIFLVIGLPTAIISGCNSEPANPPAKSMVEAPKAPEPVAPTNVSEAAQNAAPAANEATTKTESTATSAQPHPLDKVAPLIPRDVLFGNPDKAMARMSHDGKRLAYLAPVKFEDGEEVLNVWVGPIDDPSAAKAVTHEKARPIEAYFWAYTNNHILYVQDDKGDENFHVYAVDLESGDTKDITPLDPDKATDENGQKKKVRAEIEGVSWRSPSEIVIGLNARDPKYHDLYLVNIATGEHKLIQENPEYSGFVVDEDYKVRFASKMTGDGGEVLLEPDGSGRWKEYMKIGKEDTLTTGPSGFDKSGQVLYLTDSRGRDTGALEKIDLKTGEETMVAENPLADVGGVMEHPTENTIQGVAFDYDRVHWQFFDKDVEADYNRLKHVADGEIQIVSRTLDDKKWLVGFVMDDGPVRYYVYDRETKEPKFLFSNRKDLEGQPLQKMHPVVIEARDGLKLVSYLTLPPGSDPGGTGRPDKPLPMVLDVHGGPWARDSWGLNPEHQLWANRGYAVLSVNYRGSTGFGKKFANAGNKEWAGKMHDDLIDAVDWAVKEKIADPNNVAIVGGSYGGYATLVGLTFTPEKFACGVDEVGPSNLITLIENVPEYWKPEIEMFHDRVGDQTTEEGKKFLWEHSPLSKVDEIKRPLLIGQGANDPRVNQREADQIVKAMDEKRIPVTYVLFPDEGHGFARPENEMAFSAVSEAFLAKNLGGRYEPIGEAFDGSTITVPSGADDVPGLAKALESHKTPATVAGQEERAAK